MNQGDPLGQIMTQGYKLFVFSSQGVEYIDASNGLVYKQLVRLPFPDRLQSLYHLASYNDTYLFVPAQNGVVVYVIGENITQCGHFGTGVGMDCTSIVA